MKKKCIKCGGSMEEGYRLDFNTDVQRESWVPSSIADLGDKLNMDIGKSFKISVARLPIVTFGCSSCGYLESYLKKFIIPPEPPMKNSGEDNEN